MRALLGLGTSTVVRPASSSSSARLGLMKATGTALVPVVTLMVLDQACQRSPDLPVRFAALCHDFGKGLTPPAFWPSHHGHGQKGLPLIRDFCERFRVPNDCRDLALLVSDLHTHIHIAFDLKPPTLLKVFDKADADANGSLTGAEYKAYVAAAISGAGKQAGGASKK